MLVLPKISFLKCSLPAEKTFASSLKILRHLMGHLPINLQFYRIGHSAHLVFVIFFQLTNVTSFIPSVQ